MNKGGIVKIGLILVTLVLLVIAGLVVLGSMSQREPEVGNETKVFEEFKGLESASLNPADTTPEVINETDNIPENETVPAKNGTCPSGYILEDGQCVNEDFVNENVNENAPQVQGGAGVTGTSRTGTSQPQGGQEEEGISEQANETFNEIMDNIPDEVKGVVGKFIGNEDEFKKMLDDFLRSNETNASGNPLEVLKDRFGRLVGPSGIDTSKFDPMLAGLVSSSTSESAGFGGIQGFFGGLLQGPQNLISPSQKYSFRDYRNDYVIDHMETEWKSDGTRYLSIFFKSYAAMYAYIALQPITIYFDLDDDGDWDVEYKVLYDMDRGKAFYNIVKRNDPVVNARELEYDTTNKKVTFKLGNEIQGQRAFFWIGQESTRYRYPRANDIILFLDNGMMVKNNMEYEVVLLDRLKVNNDGDPFQEGEIFVNTYTLMSKPIEDLNCEEARRLVEYKRQGKVSDKEIPHWFAYWLVRGGAEGVDGVEWQRSSFPVLKWVEMNDGDSIFTDDTQNAYSAFPMFAENYLSVKDARIIYMAAIVGDYDDWPSTITDKTGWLMVKLFDYGADASGPAGQLIKQIVSLMYYGVSGENKEFDDIMKSVFDTIFSFLGSPDYIGAPSRSLNNIPTSSDNVALQASSGGAQVVFRMAKIRVPTVPLHLTAKINKVHIKDRSDGLRGEFYMYGRVCTDVNYKGLSNGASFSWPAKKFGDCVTEKLKHSYKKVWNGDNVARNFRVIEGDVRLVPFVYFEVQGWDEDKENLGDDDDPMGLVTRVILLDENNFQWSYNSNKPRLVYNENAKESKINVDFTISVVGSGS